MKTKKILIAIITLSVICVNANAQINRINRAVQRGVENALEKKAEEKAEEAVTNALEKAEADRAKNEAEAEKALQNVLEALEKAQENDSEVEAEIAKMPNVIPTVGSAPYTPSESEYAFFLMKKGAVQLLVSKNAEGKITSQSRNTIKNITGEKNAFAIEYETEALDDKGKPIDNKDNPVIINYRVVIKDGLMYFDMKEMFGAMEGIDGVQASGTARKIPSNLTVGQTIEDSKTAVKIGFINCLITMTEGKCLAIENVTVEAGTFRCHKVSQKINSTVMGIKSESTVITWYAKGVGAVKTENYDKNGKLQSVQELKSNT